MRREPTCRAFIKAPYTALERQTRLFESFDNLFYGDERLPAYFGSLAIGKADTPAASAISPPRGSIRLRGAAISPPRGSIRAALGSHRDKRNTPPRRRRVSVMTLRSATLCPPLQTRPPTNPMTMRYPCFIPVHRLPSLRLKSFATY